MVRAIGHHIAKHGSITRKGLTALHVGHPSVLKVIQHAHRILFLEEVDKEFNTGCWNFTIFVNNSSNQVDQQKQEPVSITAPQKDDYSRQNSANSLQP